MILIDVNVLIYAHRPDLPQHSAYRDWLRKNTCGPEPYGYCDLAFSGFLRIVTNPRVFVEPTPLDQAVLFVERLRGTAYAVRVSPGVRHWEIFIHLCRRANARGNLVPDAYFAALAIESGSEWITSDRDYARFPGLRWRHPFA